MDNHGSHNSKQLGLARRHWGGGQEFAWKCKKEHGNDSRDLIPSPNLPLQFLTLKFLDAQNRKYQVQTHGYWTLHPLFVLTMAIMKFPMQGGKFELDRFMIKNVWTGCNMINSKQTCSCWIWKTQLSLQFNWLQTPQHAITVRKAGPEVRCYYAVPKIRTAYPQFSHTQDFGKQFNFSEHYIGQRSQVSENGRKISLPYNWMAQPFRLA